MGIHAFVYGDAPEKHEIHDLAMRAAFAVFADSDDFAGDNTEQGMATAALLCRAYIRLGDLETLPAKEAQNLFAATFVKVYARQLTQCWYKPRGGEYAEADAWECVPFEASDWVENNAGAFTPGMVKTLATALAEREAASAVAFYKWNEANKGRELLANGS